MKMNYYLRGNRWSKKRIDKITKRPSSVLVTNLPLVSVFLIMEDGVTSRGVALCSDSDNPDKYVGRWLAHINAIEARDSKKSSKRILRSEAINVMDRVTCSPEFIEEERRTHYIIRGFGYRSEYNAILIPCEKKLLGMARGRENNKHPIADVETALKLMGKTGIEL